jgi:hypothetical protein
MATPELPQELLVKLAGQVAQDPGIPVPSPTVSAWQEPPHPLATIQSENLPQYTDFAIIGSGITGCSAAKTILESELGRDKRVVVFEARSLTTGATSRNGGFLLSHVPQFYGQYADALGAAAAKEIAVFCDRTLEEIIQVGKEENLDKVSEIRDVTTVSSYEDDEGFEKSCRSIRMYEEAVLGSKEKYTILDGETAKKVRRFISSHMSMPLENSTLTISNRHITSRGPKVLWWSSLTSAGHTS